MSTGEGDEDRRSAHRPRDHRRPGTRAAERLHPALHRLVQGCGRADEGERQRGFNSARRRSEPVPTSLCPGSRRAISCSTGSMATGVRRSPGRGMCARKFRMMPRASRSSRPAARPDHARARHRCRGAEARSEARRPDHRDGLCLQCHEMDMRDKAPGVSARDGLGAGQEPLPRSAGARGHRSGDRPQGTRRDRDGGPRLAGAPDG